MPIPAGYARGVIGGSCSGDIWEFGIWGGDSPTNQSEADAAATTLAGFFADNLQTFFVGHNAADVSALYAKIYCYPTGGPNAAFIGVHTMSVSGSSGTSLPLQTALVVTTLTGAAGRRNRGRAYFPYTAGALDTTHQVPATDCAALATGFAAFAGNNSYVVSQTAGSARLITQVRVDSKPDVQRRRQNRVAALHVVTEDTPVP